MLDALVAEARLRWGLDLAAGLQVIAAERLVATPLEASRPVLLVPLAVLRVTAADGEPAPEPLPGRHGPAGRDPLRLLARLYPADHAVGRFGVAEGTTIAALTEEALATPLYLAPVPAELAVTGPWAMPWISDRLRRPDGCPWDREQTHASLRKHLLEETYEVYDALEGGATPELAEELGDLLLQIVLHAQLAAEAGVFDLADVQAASDVNRQWERIKADERAEARLAAGGPGGTDGDGAATPAKSALDGISASMPALAASAEMQERAANLGYDWPSIEGVLDKVSEELAELRAAGTDAEWAEEFGDLLFVLVNVARKHGIEAEAAVRSANDKFRRRFRSVERQAAGRGVALRELDFAALDELWHAAKAEEATT